MSGVEKKNISSVGWALGFFLASLLIYSAVDVHESHPNPNDIQVVSVDRTPQGDDIELRIQYPNEGHIETGSPVHTEIRVDWFPLGVDSDFPRSQEVENDSEGQSLHVFVDQHEYFEVYEALFNAIDDHDEYFDQIAEWDIPFVLEKGPHVIRAVPCRSYGESLKSAHCFDSSIFYYQNKEGTPPDLTKPFLTYNTPQGVIEGISKPVLLDFYISNCVLSKDGYKVRLTIDGTNQRFLYNWTPYYIYGLSAGKHTIRLELMNPQNKLVSGPFNDVTRVFELR